MCIADKVCILFGLYIVLTLTRATKVVEMDTRMKSVLIAIVIVGICGMSSGNEGTSWAEGSPVQLKTEGEKLSYSIGMSIASDLKQMLSNLGPESGVVLTIVEQGLGDALAGRKLLLSPEEAKIVQQEFGTKMRAKGDADRKASGDKASAEGEAFLAQNKTKPGIKTTSSGLQYEVLTEGTGKKPLASDTVKVHYRGTLIDGTEFDSSYKRGEPISFPLNGVIPGWTEGLQLMTEGSKYRLFIPSALGYGAAGAGAKIPPNSVLVFEVELLGINKGDEK